MDARSDESIIVGSAGDDDDDDVDGVLLRER